MQSIGAMSGLPSLIAATQTNPAARSGSAGDAGGKDEPMDLPPELELGKGRQCESPSKGSGEERERARGKGVPH